MTSPANAEISNWLRRLEQGDVQHIVITGPPATGKTRFGSWLLNHPCFFNSVFVFDDELLPEHMSVPPPKAANALVILTNIDKPTFIGRIPKKDRDKFQRVVKFIELRPGDTIDIPM